MRGVALVPPPFAVNNSNVDLDLSGQGKLDTVAAQKGEGDDGVGGCNFHSLIEVAPPLFSPMCQQASCLRQESCLYVLPAAPAIPDFNTPTPLASMSEPPSDLAL